VASGSAPERCERHPYEAADTRCSLCDRLYCAGCVTRPRGTRFGPYCIHCALALCGIGPAAYPQEGIQVSAAPG